MHYLGNDVSQELDTPFFHFQRDIERGLTSPATSGREKKGVYIIESNVQILQDSYLPEYKAVVLSPSFLRASGNRTPSNEG